MTRSEFSRWLAHHTSRFTAISTWLSKFPNVPGASELSIVANQQAIVDGWYNVMCQCDYSDAIQATDRIHAGLSPMPESFDEWPATVAKQCRMDRSRRMDSATSDRYRPSWKEKCFACHDEGVRFGVMAKCIDEASDNTTLFHECGIVYEGAYACDRCDKGRARSDEQTGDKRRVRLAVWQDGMIDTSTPDWIKASYQQRRAIVCDKARERMQGDDFTSQFD